MRRRTVAHHWALVAILAMVAILSVARRSGFGDMAPPLPAPSPHASASPSPSAAPSERKLDVLAPDLYEAARAAEVAETHSGQGNWPSQFCIVEHEGRRYGLVLLVYFGSSRKTMLFQQALGGPWELLGRISRIGGGNTGKLTVDEKKDLGIAKLPPGVWEKLREIDSCVFDKEADGSNHPVPHEPGTLLQRDAPR